LFFYLSKIIWALLAPANMVFILIALGLLMGLKWGEAGRFFVITGFSVLFILGFLPMGQNLLYRLEKQGARPSPMPAHIDGILVLGGAIETRASEISGHPEFNDGAERILSAMELARHHPDAKIVFSGGSGLLIHNERRESQDIALFLKNMGFDTRNVIYEDQSRNTFENIRNTMNLVQPGPRETWLLVTSAYHMPRSMAVARKLGWGGILPYSVDYRSPGRYVLWPTKFDVLDNLDAADLSLREMAGYLAYRQTGKL
jgi:uncharacterized SAM-binding protein YcdF (DUF218 family)